MKTLLIVGALLLALATGAVRQSPSPSGSSPDWAKPIITIR